jgi:hypothetical protein
LIFLKTHFLSHPLCIENETRKHSDVKLQKRYLNAKKKIINANMMGWVWAKGQTQIQK